MLGKTTMPSQPLPEDEVELESELLRLQQELRRLSVLNQQLKSEIFFQEGLPAAVKKNDFFKYIPEVDYTPPPDSEDPPALPNRVDSFGEDENADQNVKEVEPAVGKTQSGTLNEALENMAGHVNKMVVKGSALSLTRPAQAVIYMIALGFVVFVLVATATHLGAPAPSDHAECHGNECAEGAHRRLGGGVSPLMRNIGFTLTGAGLFALVMGITHMPLILGYLVGGFVVGPTCLNIVESHEDISELSMLGLVFLLFMVGLELDVHALFQMGRDSLITGFVQFPLCASVLTGIFYLVEAAGLSFGNGRWSILYCGICAGLSSTMIIVKILNMKGQAETMFGRNTMAIIICQDIWAIILLASQSNLSNPTFGGIIKSFGMLILLTLLALAYAKFVMPGILRKASQSVELMLVLSLAWVFFVCSAAILPTFGLPLEMAALVAGTALGTFPYSHDFNSKIKYIRDFFFTIFFAAMGMMLPVPRLLDIVTAIFIAVALVAVRAIGVFVPLYALSKDARTAILTTLNLAQLGEFSLVICALGTSHGHIDERTLEIMILSFVFTSIVAPAIMLNDHRIWTKISAWFQPRRGDSTIEREESSDDREIMLLGFHKIAFMLIAEFQAKTPELLQTFHVIDFNRKVTANLEKLGVKCTVGDIADTAVMLKAKPCSPRIVISTVPDTLLQGINNLGLLEKIREVWPDSHAILTADNPQQAKILYEGGADYVLRMAKLSAERLHELLSEHCADGEHSSLHDLFEHYKGGEKDHDAGKLMGFTL